VEVEKVEVDKVEVAKRDIDKVDIAKVSVEEIRKLKNKMKYMDRDLRRVRNCDEISQPCFTTKKVCISLADCFPVAVVRNAHSAFFILYFILKLEKRQVSVSQIRHNNKTKSKLACFRVTDAETTTT
jgi:uncharacterized sporulation protein YeaH/YhbH (DUF444 family)